jgi:O-antigen ligase
MIFCLPFSKAMIEITISAAIGLWLLNKISLAYTAFHAQNGSVFKKIAGLFRKFKEQYIDTNRPLFVYIGICFFSIFISSNILISARAFFFKTLEYFLLYLVIIDTFHEEKKIKFICTLALISAVIIAVDALFQYFSGYDFILYRKIYASRITATFQAPNDLAGYLISFILISIMMSFSKFKNKIINFLLMFEAIFLMIILFISWTRGAWIGLIAGLLLLSVFKGKKAFYGIIIALAIAIFISPVWIKDRIYSFFTLTDTSTLDRRIMWHTAVRMIEAKPLLGHGLGTFMANYSHFMPADYTEIVYAHNCFLQIAAEIGIIGLIIFLWFILDFFIKSFRKLNCVDENLTPHPECHGYEAVDEWHSGGIPPRGWKTENKGATGARLADAVAKRVNPWDSTKNIFVGLLGGILAFLVHSFFDTNMYSLTLVSLFWFLMGITVSIRNINPKICIRPFLRMINPFL